jgi:hypothetical protein
MYPCSTKYTLQRTLAAKADALARRGSTWTDTKGYTHVWCCLAVSAFVFMDDGETETDRIPDRSARIACGTYVATSWCTSSCCGASLTLLTVQKRSRRGRSEVKTIITEGATGARATAVRHHHLTLRRQVDTTAGRPLQRKAVKTSWGPQHTDRQAL